MQIAQKSGFQTLPELAIALPKDAIVDLCNRWRIEKFYLFGSVLRSDFHGNSDIDVMVEFSPEAHWGWDIVLIKNELEAIFAHKVDLMTKKSIEESRNWARKEEILSTSRLIYVSR